MESKEPAPSAFAAALQAALDEKDADAALDLCRERLREAPHDAEAHRNLALLYVMDGKGGAAFASARRACELAPNDPRCWSDLGRVYATQGAFAEAAQCFTEAVEIEPRYADGWHNLGAAFRKLGIRHESLTAFKNALLINPTRADTYLSLAALLSDARQFEDALEALECAASHDDKMPQTRSRLAGQLSRKGKVKRAEDLYRQSLSMDPEHIDGWLGLGQTLEDLGDADGARSAYLNALRLRSDHAMALGHYLAILPKDDSPAEDGFDWRGYAETLLHSDATIDEAKAFIGYGLLKYYDRRDDIAAASEAGRLANAARRRVAGPLDREALKARVDQIINTYNSAFFRERHGWGVGTDQPVFIVGLPRSGTTLTEQILSAHPLLHGAGELPELSRLAASVLGGDTPSHAASLIDENRSRTLAGDYLKALRDGAPKKRLRIADKSPLNFFHLAFAALLFPNARVVHCVRDPRDNALSIWMQNFNAQQTYATDFTDLAYFHAQQERLMSHWRRVLPLNTLEMRYEDTVADVEGAARNLIKFLGAPWDKRCLNFHAQQRTVQTPSRWQVRQPIYSRSIDRWTRYADYLPEINDFQ